MEFLTAMFSPALSKVLEVCFLTGYATACKMEQARKLPGGVTMLPRLGSSKLHSSRSLSTGGSLPRTSSKPAKALPNDPQRQGNIWHRYEQLENATKSLSNVNQQLVDERTRHKKEKKQLEDALMELRIQNEQLQGGGGGSRIRSLGSTPQPLSPESEAVVTGLDNVPDERSEKLARELREAQSQLDQLRDQYLTLSRENAELRNPSGSTPGRRFGQQTEGPLAVPVPIPPRPSSGTDVVAPTSPFTSAHPLPEEDGDITEAREGGATLTSFGSDILPAQSSGAGGGSAPAALEAENQQLQMRVAQLKAELAGASAIGGGLFVGTAAGGAAQLSKLQQENRQLTEENRRLQSKVLRVDSEPVRAQELEEKYNKLLEENTRLQSKVVRLNLGPSPVASGDAAALEELREENAELREDNDKLVAYLEALEKKKKELEEIAGLQAQGASTTSGALGQFVQLKSDNQRILDENRKLKQQLEDAKLNSQGSYTAVPVPVRVETGEEIDKDLWMLVEELRDQNRKLIEEMQLKKEANGESKDITEEDSSEIEKLQRQLQAVMESKAAEINDDNIRLVNNLSDENTQLQQENMRLTKKLAASGTFADGEVLRETIGSNERLLSEKQKVMLECRRLADKNTRLIYENEALLKQLAAPDNNSIALGSRSSDSFKGGSGNLGAQKGLSSKFSKMFRRKQSSKDHKHELTEDDLLPSSTEASVSSSVGGSRDLRDATGPTPRGAPRQLVQELIDENSKLFDENKRLGASVAGIKDLEDANAKLQEENARLQSGMGLVKELTDENSKLVQENKRLSESINKSLADNRELSNRLIDIALQNDDDVFDAAFGDDSSGPKKDRVAAVPIDTTEVQRRQRELVEEMRLAEEQQAKDAERRNELSMRAVNQLQEYEEAKASSAQAYKKAASGAIARLATLNQKASESPARANWPAQQEHGVVSFPVTADREEGEAGEGTFDEALRRRKEADMAKAELSKKIEASRKRREDEAKGAGESAAAAPLDRAQLEQRHQNSQAQQDADEKVRKAYFRWAGTDDLGAFMKSLGYEGFSAGTTGDDEIIDVFQKAMTATTEEQRNGKTAEARALATAANNKLQEWYAQYTSPD